MLRYWLQILRRGLLYFVREGCVYRAAALSYSTLLSLVPLLTISLVVLNKIPGFGDIALRVHQFLLQTFVSRSASSIISYLESFAQHAVWLGSASILFLFAVCLLMVYNMNRAFNAIWGVSRRRHLVRAFIIYALLLVLLPIFLAMIVAVITYVAGLPFFVQIESIPGVGQALIWLMPIAFILIAFCSLNWLLPATYVPVRAALAGGVFSTALFQLAKWAFTGFIKYFSNYHFIYGTVALLPIFLIWMYISWLIILFGAVVTRLVSEELRVAEIVSDK